MKSENGVTLVALVVTIILIFIIASVTTNTNLSSYRIMKAQNFVAKMQVIQEKDLLSRGISEVFQEIGDLRA